MNYPKVQWKDTQDQVMRAFVNQEVNRYGEIAWRSSSDFYFESPKSLESPYFGWSTPLAFRLEGEQDNDNHLIVINAQRVESRGWGGGVDRQRMALRNLIPVYRRVFLPLDVIDAAGIEWDELRRENIVDFSDGESVPVIRDTETGRVFHAYRKDKPDYSGQIVNISAVEVDTQQGAFSPTDLGNSRWLQADFDTDRYTYGQWHRMGGVVLEWKGDHYIVGTDEGRYFMSKLPGAVKTVEEAIESLKPEPVKAAEAAGLKVQRQGEFFFVPTDLTDGDVMSLLGYEYVTHLRRATKPRVLPKVQADSDNVHTARVPVAADGTMSGFAIGKVYHRQDLSNRWWTSREFGDVTGEHRSLSLGDVWHRFHLNTAGRSWSIAGRAD